MDNSTVKEAWIDKLIDEFVDAKTDASNFQVSNYQLKTLLKIILNNTDLDYSGDKLRITDERAILEYTRVIAEGYYNQRVRTLLDKKEAERKRLEALEAASAEVAATEEA
jgi:hypothetical protein